MDPTAPLIFIGAVVLIAVAALYVDRAGSGGHVWSEGAAMRAPARGATNITRHVWRPGAGEDTIRVDVLLARIAEERRPGRHALIDYPPALDEGQGDEDGGQLPAHSPLSLAA